MKPFAVPLFLALLLGAPSIGAAEILELSTSISVPPEASDEDFKDAIRVAARDVLRDIRSLRPVMMVVTAAYLSAGRLYVRFVVADEAGARMLGVPPDEFEDPDALRL